MIIAVSYKDGEIYEHFGHAEYFAIYTTNNDQTEITGKKVIEVKETGHQAVADLMDENGVEVVIVGNIGSGARQALKFFICQTLHSQASAAMQTTQQSS